RRDQKPRLHPLLLFGTAHDAPSVPLDGFGGLGRTAGDLGGVGGTTPPAGRTLVRGGGGVRVAGVSPTGRGGTPGVDTRGGIGVGAIAAGRTGATTGAFATTAGFATAGFATGGFA